jgi:hypothetical protein
MIAIRLQFTTNSLLFWHFPYQNHTDLRFSGENAHIDYPIAMQADYPKLFFFNTIHQNLKKQRAHDLT